MPKFGSSAGRRPLKAAYTHTHTDTFGKVYLTFALCVFFLHLHFLIFFHLNFAAWVLLARWSEAGGRLLASAGGALVGVPGLAGFVDAAGARFFAAAELLRAGGDGGVASALLAAACVTFVFPGRADIVAISHVSTFGRNDAGASVTSDLAILVTSASGTAVSLGEDLSDCVSVSIVHARAGFVGAGDLAVALTGAGVALFWDGLSNGQRHRTILAVARDGIV